MLAEALQVEVDAYVARFAVERDKNGRRLVVPQRLPPEPGDRDQCGRDLGDGPAGQRQAH